MKLLRWGVAALMALALSSPSDNEAAGASPRKSARNARKASTQASEEVVRQATTFEDELNEAELAQYVSSPGGGLGGGSAFGTAMSGVMSRPIQFFGGAQYINARANVSQGLAYVRQDVINGVEDFVQYDFNYKSSYGIFGGINLTDCGGAIVFDYTRLRSDASTSAVEVPGQVNIFGPYEVDRNVRATADVDLKSYNLGFSKTIPLGCPLQGGCSGCDDTCCAETCCTDDPCCTDSCCTDGGCGNGCGGAGCPAWDITWTGGVRYAEASWARGLDGFDVLNTTLLNRSSDVTMDFSGFGGRIGIGGRRYFGSQGLMSVYAKGDVSVLVGDIEVVNTVFSRVAQASTVTRTSCTHVVPVTEIELGGALHLGRYANLSAGYFFSAWHDLGFRDEYNFQQFQTSHYDDANILGFDGFFARAEVTF